MTRRMLYTAIEPGIMIELVALIVISLGVKPGSAILGNRSLPEDHL